jgi:hypothetical protein
VSTEPTILLSILKEEIVLPNMKPVFETPLPTEINLTPEMSFFQIPAFIDYNPEDTVTLKVKIL